VEENKGNCHSEATIIFGELRETETIFPCLESHSHQKEGKIAKTENSEGSNQKTEK
jgi:hypothetical protein